MISWVKLRFENVELFKRFIIIISKTNDIYVYLNILSLLIIYIVIYNIYLHTKIYLKSFFLFSIIFIIFWYFLSFISFFWKKYNFSKNLKFYKFSKNLPNFFCLFNKSQIGIEVCRLLPQGRVSYISIMPRGHTPHNPFPYCRKGLPYWW